MAMTPDKESSEYENTMYEERRKEILRMRPGKEREAALRDLMADYEGRSAVQSERLATGQDRFDSAMQPLDMRKGPSGNPFAVDVGPHWTEEVGRGVKMYGANKEVRDARKRLKGLSEGKERAGMALAGSGAMGDLTEDEKRKKKQEAQARAARRGMTRA